MDHRAFVEHSTCVMDHEPCFMEHRTIIWSWKIWREKERQRDGLRIHVGHVLLYPTINRSPSRRILLSWERRKIAWMRGWSIRSVVGPLYPFIWFVYKFVFINFDGANGGIVSWLARPAIRRVQSFLLCHFVHPYQQIWSTCFVGKRNSFFNLRSLVGAYHVCSHAFVCPNSRESFYHRDFVVLWGAEHHALWFAFLFIPKIL